MISSAHLELVNARGGWDVIGDLPRIPVAVTDVSFDTAHEDLQGQFITVYGTNNVTDFHGTAVCGLLSAVTDNGMGLSSIGFRTRIYASTLCYSDNEVLRIAQLGYRAINCSWKNGCSYSDVQNNLYSTIKNVYNTVVVFGAGNGAKHCGSPSAYVYPASYSSVLSVTSVGHINPLGHNGAYGMVDWKDCHEEVIGDNTSTHQHNAAVDLCAPGYNVPSTHPGSV